jgi:hypothetical protein
MLLHADLAHVFEVYGQLEKKLNRLDRSTLQWKSMSLDGVESLGVFS